MSLYVKYVCFPFMAACISYKLYDLIERKSLLARFPDRPLVHLIMSNPELQRLLAHPPTPPAISLCMYVTVIYLVLIRP